MTKPSFRAALLAFASSAALLSSAAVAHAQDQAAPADDETSVTELVITGSRAAPRSRLETVAPVDVITSETLARRGTGGELAAALAQEAPSINFPRPAISDGSDHVRPATLRGLAPDQTLVLVNGIRGHIGSLVNVNGSIGRGSTAFDLNTIPTVALGQVEVLREGAAAQYGADAIAGVINLRLREASSGGGFTMTAGQYNTSYDTARGHHSASDGDQINMSGWMGFQLPRDGFLTLSAEVQGRKPTNRADYVDLPTILAAGGTPPPIPYTADTVIGRFGDPDVMSASVYFNAALPLNDTWKAYAFGGFQNRDSVSAATARQYNSGNNIQAIYPYGFRPKIRTDDDDQNLFFGLKGQALGWTTDLAFGYGHNGLEYNTQETLNRTQGLNTKTSYYDGGFSYEQKTAELNVSRGFDVGQAEPLNVAAGLQYRNEAYEIHPGEPGSYNNGGAGGTPGAQGFGGFQPANAVDVKRHNWAGYIDLEGKFTDNLSYGLAGRYEDYSDFGDQTTGKLSLRYDLTPAFALRGAVSNGFKAPALQQQYFSYTATNLVTSGGVSTLVQSGKLRVNDPAAIALGATPLRPETSVNYSAGLVWRVNRFELTVDAYQIDVTDRIALSENLGVATPSQPTTVTDAVRAILLPYGVSAAQFFINGVDTTTKGVDIVAHYRLPTDTMGRFDFTLAANLNRTKVTKTPTTPATQTVGANNNFLFDRGNRLSYEEGQPEQKLIASVDWLRDGWGFTTRVTSYDSVLIPNNNPISDYETGAAVLVDLAVRRDIGDHATVTLGVDNVGDEYPNATPPAINSPTGSVGFPQYSPFGFNGRFIYTRIGFRF